MLSIEDVYSTEEWAHVPELGLKGNVDATIVARTAKPPTLPNSKNDPASVPPQEALMPVELKTGHVQNPSHTHPQSRQQGQGSMVRSEPVRSGSAFTFDVPILLWHSILHENTFLSHSRHPFHVLPEKRLFIRGKSQLTRMFAAGY